MKKISTNSSRKITNTNKFMSWVICMLLFMVAGIQSAKAQTCSGTTNIPPNGTVSINGVTITSASTGSANVYGAANTACGGTFTTDPNSLWLGQTGAFSVTLDFSSPVNNVIFVITGAGSTVDENFIFNTNGGTPSISSIASCYSTIVGNEIIAGLGAPTTGGGVFTIANSSPFTQITLTGSGGDGGSLVAICSSSLGGTCNAGVTAPTLSATTKANVCPATTVNLTTITASNLPGGTTLTWHTATPATTANKVATPSAVTAGTYYAAFFDATNNCYSGTSGNGSATTVVTATTTTCAGLTASNPSIQTVPGGQVYTGNAGTELAPTGGTSPYTYSNGSSDPACINPGGATALPPASNLTVTNSTTGAYTYTAPTTAGTYFFCIKVCDSTAPTPNCVVKTYTVVVPCAAGNTPPVLIKN